MYFGKSIRKQIIGLRVVSSNTGNPASPIQMFGEESVLLLWPLEALILFFSPKRRVGDIVARTEAQESTEIGREKKWRYLQAVLSVIASFILVFYLFNFIDSLGIMN
jgi:hypothetical protein